MRTNKYNRLAAKPHYAIGAFALALLAIPAGVRGQGFTLPSSLTGWSVTGSPLVAGANQSFTLPANGEISQSYQASRVALRVVSRPSFGDVPQNWSTVEVGPASLTFLRDRFGGGVVLLGDVPLQLPVSIVLGADGRSTVPVDFTLTLDGSRQTASVTLNGREFNLPATNIVTPIRVFLTASRSAEWAFTSIDVQVVPAIVAPAPSNPGSQSGGTPTTSTRARDRSDTIAKAATPAARALENKKNFEDALKLARAGNPAKADEALSKGNRYLSGTFGWQIESATKVTQLALSLRQRYDIRGALTAAQRALVILQEAERLSGPASIRQKATVHEMAGFLYEEILKDIAAARLAYQKALQIDNRSVRSRRALDLISEAEAKAQRLSAGTKKGGGS